jgi:hypothetical protein
MPSRKLSTSAALISWTLFGEGSGAGDDVSFFVEVGLIGPWATTKDAKARADKIKAIVFFTVGPPEI